MRLIIAALVAASSLGGGAAWAQGKDSNSRIPLTPPTAYAAAPYGARYYPGVGFRYVLPPTERGARVYGYYAGPRAYGYAVRPCRSGFWFWERDVRCSHRR
jgi:hypothetical protein